MSHSLESPTSIYQRRVSTSPTNPPHLLKMSSKIKRGGLPNNPTPLLKTITTIIINTVNIKPHLHSSPNNELHHLSSRDSTSRYLNLPLELNIQWPDPWNRLISPPGLTASVNLPCRMINPHLIPMVNQVPLQVHGFKIPVYDRPLHSARRRLGCLLLDRVNSIIPTNRSDVGYLVELLLHFPCE
jgi:hypothetical protein